MQPSIHPAKEGKKICVIDLDFSKKEKTLSGLLDFLEGKIESPSIIKKEFGDDISFWGSGCDTQEVLPFGTPEDVKLDVKQRVEHLSPGGGSVFCTVHNIQADVSPENIMAMYEALSMYNINLFSVL